MKKIFLMFILTSTFLYSDWLLTVYFPLQNQYSYYCIKENSVINKGSTTEYTMRNMSTGVFVQYTWNNSNNPQTVTQGDYFFDMNVKKCLLNSPPPEPEPEPEPEPNPNPNPTNPPITITPDENGLIMGLTPQNFHFSFALWGVALSFLMAIGLILSF